MIISAAGMSKNPWPMLPAPVSVRQKENNLGIVTSKRKIAFVRKKIWISSTPNASVMKSAAFTVNFEKALRLENVEVPITGIAIASAKMTFKFLTFPSKNL